MGVKAKDGAGSATLSMGYTGAHFADRVMAGLSGEAGVVECTFVESSLFKAPFFASKCTLGKNGVEEIHDIGNVNAYEEKLIADMMPDLIAQADKASNGQRRTCELGKPELLFRAYAQQLFRHQCFE